jgi:RNA polymerase sigma-70 factor, ECF subfamily
MTILQSWPASSRGWWRRGVPWARPRLWLAVARRDDPRALDATAGSAQAVPTDAGGFEDFFHQFERDIFGYLWRMTGEEQAAYDLSQEVFLRAWQRFARVSGYDRPRAWLFRVATNLALNYLRGRATRPDAALDTDTAERFASSDPAWRLAERDQVRHILLALAPRYRAGLLLREVYGLSCAEVAQALGTSRDAAKMLLCRAREAFRERYLREEGRP